jgi:tetratricopeptide (TPR) repeat protein
MTDTFDYIESYFAGRCTETEKQQFEERCVQDQAFAEEVAFYIQSRAILKEELLTAKKTAWAAATSGKSALDHKSTDHKSTSAKSSTGSKSAAQKTGRLRTLYLATAAAAAALLLLSLYLLTRPIGPAQLATNYIRTHYDHLSQTLDGTRDSLAQGITAYNDKSFTHALDLFTTLAHNHPSNIDARLYSGLTYLRLQNYDQALHEFDTLANMPSLYSNPGPFLKAATLLQRNAAGDRETAHQLLQDVVRRNLDGSQEAATWLQKF